MSPRGPPRGPTLPMPRSVMYCPVETPGGMSTGIVCSPRTRPSPRHFLHCASMVFPCPAHVGHGATLTNCPKNDRCARRTSPEPPQVLQRCGFVPDSDPDPSHLSQGSSSLALKVFWVPVATS